MWERIVKVASDIRTLWVTGILLFGALAFAGDLRYERRGAAEVAVLNVQIQQTRTRLKELYIKEEMGRANEYDRALIRMYEQDLENLIDARRRKARDE